MSQYRVARNLEASTIQYVESILATGGWTGITTVRSFGEVYGTNVPVICIRSGDAIHDRAEIGSFATIRNTPIFIDIFATSDGQRLDLKDFLIEKMKAAWTYYAYTITNGVITAKVASGRIICKTIKDREVFAGEDKNKLEIQDRYRHLLIINVSTGKLEA